MNSNDSQHVDERLAQNNIGCKIGIAFLENQLDAIAYLQKAIELKQDSHECYYNLGNAFIDKGYIGDAIACYQQAIIFKSDYVEAHKKLGNAFLKQGQAWWSCGC